MCMISDNIQFATHWNPCPGPWKITEDRLYLDDIIPVWNDNLWVDLCFLFVTCCNLFVFVVMMLLLSLLAPGNCLLNIWENNNNYTWIYMKWHLFIFALENKWIRRTFKFVSTHNITFSLLLNIHTELLLVI